ncbi:MAG: hypothetical protein IKT57_02840 [Clostridia bacterium]|nr:hypothetical protein [Clostridia bacterium]
MEHFVNEKTVMQFYLEEMTADRIVFLKEKPELKHQIHILIEQLLNEDKMNNKISIACKLWKVLFEAAMTDINPDKSGYDKLFKYFDAYVEFEELIFASDSFYRDHTLHCIWVYFLGEYLTRREEFHDLFLDMENLPSTLYALSELFKHGEFFDSAFSEHLSKFKDIETMLHSLLAKNESVRCISALTHDLGYPLKKIEKINKSIKKVLPFFSVNNFTDFSFEYGNIQQEFVKNFIDFISRNTVIKLDVSDKDDRLVDIFSKIMIINKNGVLCDVNRQALAELTEEEKAIILHSTCYSHGFAAPISKQLGYWNDFEEYRHGIMSAFLLCKNVRAFQSIDYNALKDDFRYKDSQEFAQIMAVQSILTSITDHTSEQFRISSLDTDSYLTFVDEIEEFSRISRASQNREYVEEFCDTALYMEDDWLNIIFEFNNTNLDNLDPEISFKGRCKRFLTLFDIRNLSPNLKLRVQCIGKLPTNQNTYCLEIARNHADIMINGESQNIPKYLKANQFYTKEEYAKQ